MPPIPATSPSRLALVTGASSGIGAATARALAKAGFKVVMIARSQGKLAALATELADLGLEAQPFVMDLADAKQASVRWVELMSEIGPVDVLVNSAGMGYTGVLFDMPMTDWQQVMALNVTSVFQATQAVLPGMRAKGAGLIVNIASIAANHAFPEWGAYGVSKAAVVALGKAIAAEESAHGIRVMTLSPGAVNTPIWDTDTVAADFDREAMLSPEIIAQTIVYSALLPPNAVISDLTLTPSQGAL